MQSIDSILPPILDEQLAKCLFLTSKPDQRSPQDIPRGKQGPGNENDRIRLINVFKEALTTKSVEPLRHELETKLLLHKTHEQSMASPLSLVERNFSELEDLLSEAEEDALELNEIFRMLSIPIPEFLHVKFNDIVTNKRIAVPPTSNSPGSAEDFKTFFIYTEYKLYSEICDVLTSVDVYHLYRAFQKDNKSNQEQAKARINVEIEEKSLSDTTVLKDVAFYYLILNLVEADNLNRLHTHRLEYHLNVIEKEKKKNRQNITKLKQVLTKLKRYPVASHPPGLCIIFCVVKGRNGAEKDFEAVEKLFKNTYKYDVLVRLDPKSTDVKRIATKLLAPKHKFYDSLVVWFMGHGTVDNLQLTDKQIHRRDEFIDVFSNIPWLCKKPKLFFIQACASPEYKAQLGARLGGGMEEEKDASPLGIRAGKEWMLTYGRFIDTSYINYFADTLISYATRWNEPASRSSIHGSIYVQTVVDQLKNCGHRESIENVLRKVQYNVNVVSIRDQKECDNWKQSPYYESSLQKEFVFPCSSDDEQPLDQEPGEDGVEVKQLHLSNPSRSFQGDMTIVAFSK